MIGLFQSKLNVFIEQRGSVPFAWGVNDCCMLGADWILAVTGSDPAEEFRNQYDTAVSAARIVEAAGGMRALAKTYCEKAGLIFAGTPIPGDIVVVPTGHDGLWVEAIGIFVGVGAAVLLPGEQGVGIMRAKPEMIYRIKEGEPQCHQ